MNANWQGGENRPCPTCLTLVWVKPSWQNRKTVFCSRTCYLEWARSQPRLSILHVSCTYCGKEFTRSQAELKRSGSCCSRLCFTMYRRNRVLLACHCCGKEYSVRAHKATTSKFCSRACQRWRSDEHKAMQRLNQRITIQIWQALRQQKAGRKWEEFVNFTLADLRHRLESLFVPGMSWSNIGQWHIDHIRPRASFSFNGPNDPDFKECWKLDNLQPLWARDNMVKGAKMPAMPSSAPN